MRRLLTLLLPLLVARSGAVTIPTGKGEFDLEWSGRLVPVWTYRPAAAGADAPIVFVCHGSDRNGSTYRDSWVAQADRHGCIVVTPEFTDAAFPGSANYNLGGMFDSGGHPLPSAQWSFDVIETVFDAVRAALGSTRQTYLLYGHSAGAQFVERMLLFAPQVRAERVVMANAGWYTLPDSSLAFPYGLAGSAWSEAQLRARWGRACVVLLGTADTDPDDPDLNHNKQTDAQGLYRLARGRYFHAQSAAAARARGVDFRWPLAYAQGIGHSNSGMTPFAAAWLLDAPSALRGEAALTVVAPVWREDFDHGYLAAGAAPVTLPWGDCTTVPGWHLAMHETGTPSNVTAQRTGVATTAGPVYLVATEAAPGNFALGARVTDANGSVPSVAGSGYDLGLRLRNGTGTVVTGFSIRWRGVQFFRGTGVNRNTITTAWRLAPAGSEMDLTGGDWTALGADFTAPRDGAGQAMTAELDFNAPGNFAVAGPVSVSQLRWAAGDELWLRWHIDNVESYDQGVGIDDVEVAATGPVLASYALGFADGAQTRVAWPVIERDGATVEYRFDRLRDDVDYTVQASADLVRWDDVATNPGKTGETVTVVASLDAAGGSPYFFRLKLTPHDSSLP